MAANTKKHSKCVLSPFYSTSHCICDYYRLGVDMESIGWLSPFVIFWVHSFSFGFRADSLGTECAAYGCNNREHRKESESGIKSKTGNSFFASPRGIKEVNCWCNSIKRKHGKDGFCVWQRTVVCEKYLRKEDLKRIPGGSMYKRINNAEPIIHPWTESKSSRKSPKREQSRRGCRRYSHCKC